MGVNACGETPSDTETISSALSTAGSEVRGWTGLNSTHTVIHRDFGQDPTITYCTQTNPFQCLNINGNVQTGSSPWGYVRNDTSFNGHTSTVLYLDPSGSIHELVGGTDSNFTSLFGLRPAAPAPANGPVPDVIGYVRADGKNGVVYRNVDNHVIEIISNFGVQGQPAWVPVDHTATLQKLPVGQGGVFPYVRSDGKNALVYVATDNHIHEIVSNGPLAYGDSDLYDPSVSTETVAPSSDIWGYKRVEANKNAVVFVGTNGTLQELSLTVGTLCNTGKPWCADAISAAQSPATGLSNRPSGYVRADNLNAVVYANTSGKIHELSLNGQWSDGEIPGQTNITIVGRPFGFADNSPNTGFHTSFVLYQGLEQGTDRKGIELRLPKGGTWSLNRIP
jgi:hypothetical protein